MQVKDVEQQLPEKITITVKCPMSAYQSAVYNWIKATNTVRVDPIHRRVAHGHRAWEPLQNKVMELRKVSRRAGAVCSCTLDGTSSCMRLSHVASSGVKDLCSMQTHPHVLRACTPVHVSKGAKASCSGLLASVRCMLQVCNHPRLCYPDTEDFWEANVVRTCGKMYWLDQILVKLYSTGHRVLLFSTMTRMLDTVEFYLSWRKVRHKQSISRAASPPALPQPPLQTASQLKEPSAYFTIVIQQSCFLTGCECYEQGRPV